MPSSSLPAPSLPSCANRVLTPLIILIACYLLHWQQHYSIPSHTGISVYTFHPRSECYLYHICSSLFEHPKVDLRSNCWWFVVLLHLLAPPILLEQFEGLFVTFSTMHYFCKLEQLEEVSQCEGSL
jgi:hypothetical protein